MKFIYVTVLGFLLSTGAVSAQHSVVENKPNSYYLEGKEMYLSQNYVGALQMMEQYQKESLDTSLIQNADFFILASQYYLGDLTSIDLFKEYLEANPSTIYRNQISAILGSYYYNQESWELSKYWYSQVNATQLSDNEVPDYYFKYGYVSLKDGDYDRASLYMKRLLDNREFEASASYYLAYMDFKEKKYSDAEKVFNALKNNSTYSNSSYFYLTQIAFINEDYQSATNLGEYCIDRIQNYTNEEKCELYRILGSSYYQLGNENKSFVNYQLMQECSLGDANIAGFPLDNYRLGELYYKKGNYSQAIEQLTKAASGTETLKQSANMLLGQCYLKEGNNDKALMYFDLAAKANNNPMVSEDALYNYVLLTGRTTDVFGQSVDAYKQFLDKYPNSKYNAELNKNLAQILLSTQDYNLALSTIHSIKNPSKALIEVEQITLYQQGVQYFLNKEYKEAIGKFDPVIDLDGYNLAVQKDAFYWRAESLYQLGDFENAGQDFLSYTSSVDMGEDNYLPALYNLGYCYFKQKEYNKALSSFSQYISLADDKTKPIYLDAICRVGDCYLFRKDYSQASEYYQRAMDMPGKEADYAYLQKAFVQGLQKDYKGKINTLNQLIDKYPQSAYLPNALFEQSRAYIMTHNDKQALASAEKLVKDYPQSPLVPRALIQIGQLYYNDNNNNKAIASYKQLLQNYSNSEESVIALNSLEAIYKDINDINSYAKFVNSLGGNKISSSRQDTLTFQAAENIMMRGASKQSQKAMEDYLSSYPQGGYTSDANFYLGTMYFDQKDLNRASKSFGDVIKTKNPKYMEESLIYVSGIEFDNKNYDGAYAYYKQLQNSTSNPKNKNVANLGMIRSAYLMNRDKEVVEVSNVMLADKQLSTDVYNETNFYRGKSLNNLKDMDGAYKAFEVVAKNIRTEQGSESKYELANILYQQKKYDQSIKQINDFISTGTPYKDWMAKSVILLSDNYKAKGDANQALQYLESLQSNYKENNPEIQNTIATKIKELQPQ